MHYSHCTCPCHHQQKRSTATVPTYRPGKAACSCGYSGPKTCHDQCHHCGGAPATPHCPPPPMPCHEGTATLPPHDPPPTVHTEPPDVDKGRPGKGNPGETGWFGGRVKGIINGQPSFGPRKNEYLPYLLVRSNPSDRGARAVSGVFWESPDIFVRPGVPANLAPLTPPLNAGSPVVGSPTTLYAHVWNLGRAAVWGAYVEFSWFNPSLGFNYANANRLGAAMIDLGDRFTSFPEWREASGPAGDRYLTRGCHAIVKCPATWMPTWENGGHECLVVRVFEQFMDPVELTNYNARIDRHIGQRNITVVQAKSPAELDLMLDVGPTTAPGRAEVEISIDQPGSMPWLQLYAGPGGVVPRPAATPLLAGLLPPTMPGARRIDLSGLATEQRRPFLSDSERFHLGCDPVQIGFHAAADLEQDEAYVVRVRQHVEGTLVGGYTVVLVKS
jgi:hypothetical protein